MPEIVLIHSTFTNEAEAVSVARALLSERLVACANISQVRSLYRWDGAVQDAPESMLLVKTSMEKQQLVMARIRALHSYTLPCIAAYPLSAGDAAFLAWVSEEVA